MRRPDFDFDPRLMAFELKAIWRAMLKQPLAFWLLCTYVFFEYLRPQVMYPVINFAPWGQLTLLAMLGGVLVTGSFPKRLGAMEALFAAFVVWVLISGFSAWNPGVAWNQRNTLLSWIILYFAIVSVIKTPRSMLLFVIFFVAINFKMSQYGTRSFASRGFTFARWGLSGTGWFANSGELAMELCIMFAFAWAMISAHREHLRTIRRWVLIFLFPMTALIAVIGSSSRGGQLALVVMIVAFVIMAPQARGRRLRGITAMVVLMGIAWAAMPAAQKDRFRTMGDDETSQRRLELWADARSVAEQHPVFGIGYRNWLAYYSANFEHENEYLIEVVHNTVLEGYVELGIPGITLFLLQYILALAVNFDTGRRLSKSRDPAARSMQGIAVGLNVGLLASIVAAQFMSVLFYPFFWLSFALTAALRNMVVTQPFRARLTVRKTPRVSRRGPSLAVQPQGSPVRST